MNGPKIGAFCWNDLATPNVKASKEFYGELLGWKFTDVDMGEVTYTMIQCEDEEFGGMWQIPTEQNDHIPPHWMAYILVDDIENTLSKAIKMGATVKLPITQAGEKGCFSIIIDPTGAHIAFWQSSGQ